MALSNWVTALKEKLKQEDAVYFDAVNGVAGTDPQVGTRLHPVNNGPDLRTILAARGLKKVCLLSDFTLDADMATLIWDSETKFTSVSSFATPTINFNSYSVNNGVFHNLLISSLGVTVTDTIHCERCFIVEIGAPGVGIDTVYLRQCILVMGGDTIVAEVVSMLDCSGSHILVAVNIQVKRFHGDLALFNATEVISVELYGGTLTIGSTCAPVFGITVSGDCELVDHSAGVVFDYRTRAEIKKYARVPVTSASANLKNSNDLETATNELAYIKVKETIINADMAGVRVKFDLKTENVLGTAYGQIYFNGAPAGIERTDVTGGYVTFSEDFAELSAGTKIQLWAHVSDALYLAYVQNLRLYYDIADTLSVTNNDP